MRRLRILLGLSLLAAASCGRVTDLKPEKGEALPVKPMMARTTPTPNDLLTRPAYAKPDRVDELVKRSQPRPEDPFDLPPPTGGSAPSEPAGSTPATVNDNTSVSHPGD